MIERIRTCLVVCVFLFSILRVLVPVTTFGDQCRLWHKHDYIHSIIVRRVLFIFVVIQNSLGINVLKWTQISHATIQAPGPLFDQS